MVPESPRSRVCAAQRAGADPGRRAARESSQDLAAAVAGAGAEARLVPFPQDRPLLEPTAAMLDSSDWADLSIGLLKRTYAEELSVRRLVLDRLLAHGGRAIGADGIDETTLYGELSAPMPDLEQQARRLLAVVDGAREVRVRGAAGTDLTLRVDGRRWLNDALPLEPGRVANFPGGEICIAPLADGAERGFQYVSDDPLGAGGRAAAGAGAHSLRRWTRAVDRGRSGR